MFTVTFWLVLLTIARLFVPFMLLILVGEWMSRRYAY